MAKEAPGLACIAWHMNFDARRQRLGAQISGHNHFDPGHVSQIAHDCTHHELPFVCQGRGSGWSMRPPPVINS